MKSYYDNSFLTNDLTSGNNIIMGRPFSWKRQININKSQNSLNLKVQIFSEINSKVADLELYKTIQ